MKEQTTEPKQPDTHFDRFMDVARKVATTSGEDYQKHVEQEKQEKAKKKPEQS